ncbi:sigma-70 family RNA polymerase sigma factor [Paraburkholderia sp. SIMBA_030]|uniref:sigma-70 family RNA polymerase sigma factor n=1 Tax=Paraburkholderia sp. SIMBA_030 TaxID=3085773 RepID=UPI00397A7AA3
MRSRTHRPGPPLTLVENRQGGDASDPPGGTSASRTDGSLDWTMLMIRSQAGDREAYRLLLEAITPYLRTLAARKIDNRNDVEDTVQDILLTIHTVRHTYDPARPFGPWLVAIAARRIVDSLRRQGRLGAHETPFDPDHETFAMPEANLVERASDARALHEAVEALPPGQRDAIRMLKLEELSLKEASTATGASIASLKVATHRAMKNLRKLIEKRGIKS